MKTELEKRQKTLRKDKCVLAIQSLIGLSVNKACKELNINMGNVVSEKTSVEKMEQLVEYYFEKIDKIKKDYYKNWNDTPHEIVKEIELTDAELHRYVNDNGELYSGIFVNGKEYFSERLEWESILIRDWEYMLRDWVIEENPKLIEDIKLKGNAKLYRYENEKGELWSEIFTSTTSHSKYLQEEEEKMINEWNLGKWYKYASIKLENAYKEYTLYINYTKHDVSIDENFVNKNLTIHRYTDKFTHIEYTAIYENDEIELCRVKREYEENMIKGWYTQKQNKKENELKLELVEDIKLKGNTKLYRYVDNGREYSRIIEINGDGENIHDFDRKHEKEEINRWNDSGAFRFSYDAPEESLREYTLFIDSVKHDVIVKDELADKNLTIHRYIDENDNVEYSAIYKNDKEVLCVTLRKYEENVLQWYIRINDSEKGKMELVKDIKLKDNASLYRTEIDTLRIIYNFGEAIDFMGEEDVLVNDWNENQNAILGKEYTLFINGIKHDVIVINELENEKLTIHRYIDENDNVEYSAIYKNDTEELDRKTRKQEDDLINTWKIKILLS